MSYDNPWRGLVNRRWLAQDKISDKASFIESWSHRQAWQCFYESLAHVGQKPPLMTRIFWIENNLHILLHSSIHSLFRNFTLVLSFSFVLLAWNWGTSFHQHSVAAYIPYWLVFCLIQLTWTEEHLGRLPEEMQGGYQMFWNLK